MADNIVLCGFMGSGKTTVGKELAQLMGRKFVDLDLYIEKKKKKTVNQIFEEKGEAYFRSLETKYSKKLGRKKGLILALGGGTAANFKNVEYLKKRGLIIYLKVDSDTVINRLKNDNSRPLLKEDKAEKITSLLAKREESYCSAADFTVDGRQDIKTVINEILNLNP